MKISYIVPSYNHEKYILECLDSIKDDIYCDHEIIILDDGSSDQSVLIISNWIQKNSDLKTQLMQQSNKGVCSSLNKLISSCSGDFIRPVASDDLIIAGSTKILVNALSCAPAKLVAFGDTQTIDSQSQILSDSHILFLGKNKSLYKTDLSQAIIAEWAIAGPVLVYKKGFIDQVGPYDESIVIEDWNMYLRLVGLDKLIFVDHVVAKYRLHGNNTSRASNTAKRIKNLESQYLGGAQNLNLFQRRNLNLLKSQLYLTQAKISFLKKNVFKVFLKLTQCYYEKLKIHFTKV